MRRKEFVERWVAQVRAARQRIRQRHHLEMTAEEPADRQKALGIWREFKLHLATEEQLERILGPKQETASSRASQRRIGGKMPQPPESRKPGATFRGPLKPDDPLLRMTFVVTHPNDPFSKPRPSSSETPGSKSEPTQPEKESGNT
jgi:hypothetical protein